VELVLVFLLSSEALIGPEEVSLKLLLRALKDIAPELNQGVAGCVLAVSAISE